MRVPKRMPTLALSPSPPLRAMSLLHQPLSFYHCLLCAKSSLLIFRRRAYMQTSLLSVVLYRPHVTDPRSLAGTGSLLAVIALLAFTPMITPCPDLLIC